MISEKRLIIIFFTRNDTILEQQFPMKHSSILDTSYEATIMAFRTGYRHSWNEFYFKSFVSDQFSLNTFEIKIFLVRWYNKLMKLYWKSFISHLSTVFMIQRERFHENFKSNWTKLWSSLFISNSNLRNNLKGKICFEIYWNSWITLWWEWFTFHLPLLYFWYSLILSWLFEITAQNSFLNYSSIIYSHS